MFRIGVEWWSEIVIFYGILSAIAWWEISKYAKRAAMRRLRVDNLEISHDKINNEVLDLEDRIENVENQTNHARKQLKKFLKELTWEQ